MAGSKESQVNNFEEELVIQNYKTEELTSDVNNL